MSRAERCRDEARLAERLAEQAKFADIRLGYQRSAANWRRLAAYFDGTDSLAPEALTRASPQDTQAVLASDVSGQTEACRADGKGR